MAKKMAKNTSVNIESRTDFQKNEKLAGEAMVAHLCNGESINCDDQLSLACKIKSSFGRWTYSYKFHTAAGIFSGSIIAKEGNLITLEIDTGYLEYTHMIINMNQVCVLEEYFTGE